VKASSYDDDGVDGVDCNSRDEAALAPGNSGGGVVETSRCDTADGSREYLQRTARVGQRQVQVEQRPLHRSSDTHHSLNSSRVTKPSLLTSMSPKHLHADNGHERR
jgi:hypothetical protein